MNQASPTTPTHGRLEFIDSLRGFALLGVFWANLLTFAGIAYMNDEQRNALFSPLDWFCFQGELFWIENKFMGLFSILFGVSFWLFLSRAEARGASGTSLFYRRIFWLFVIGLVHGGLLWCFDILRFYALWAVLLPLFLRTPPRRLLAVALGCAVVVPAVVAGMKAWLGAPSAPAVNPDALALTAFSTGTYAEVLVANWRYDWHLTASISQIGYQVSILGRLLLGLYLARVLNLQNLETHRPLLGRGFWGGLAVGMIGSFVFAGDFFPGASTAPAWATLKRFVVESGSLGLTLAYACGLALAFHNVRGRRIIRLLAPVGRMALTWYLFQTLVGLWMFYGFAPGPDLMGKVGAATLVLICLVGFAAQVALAQAWLRHFRFGPAEWLWRSLTYAKAQPWRA